MDEPYYEDIDEDGNAPQRGGIAKWKLQVVPKMDLLRRIFTLYGRSYFASEPEMKAWKKIAKAIDKGMPEAWIDAGISWVKYKREHNEFIPFWTLENFILNPVRYREWLAKNKMASRDVDTFKLDNDEESFSIE